MWHYLSSCFLIAGEKKKREDPAELAAKAAAAAEAERNISSYMVGGGARESHRVERRSRCGWCTRGMFSSGVKGW
jgi:hypothetical protein